jgi:ParB family chromosome partitioning protein
VSATAATESNAGVFYEAIALDTIAPSKSNPRKHLDEAELQELAASIKDKGVIQPIVIRPKTGKPQWEIVAGERRWRASKLAGLAGIPAIARTLDDKAVLEIQVIENLQRADIHPLEEANGYRELLDKHKYTADVIAEKVGKSKEYVYGRMKLSDLIPELQTRFFENKITAGHAILLARLPEQSQVLAAKQLFDEDYFVDPESGKEKQEKVTISVRELQSFIRREIQMDLSQAPFDIADPDLLRQAGACIACPKRTGAEPQLWPEVGKRDLCGDRACYHKKLNAYIDEQCQAGVMIKLSSEYSNRDKKGMTHVGYDTAKIGPGVKSCDDAVTGIYIDGHDRGQTLKICPNKSCAVHYRRNGSSSYVAPKRTAVEQLKNAQESIEANMQAELGRRLYAAAAEKLDLIGPDIAKLAKKQALQMVLRLVYDRLDSSVRRKVTEQLKLKKAQYSQSAQNTQVDAYSDKLGIPEILALTITFGCLNLSMGFTGGWSDRDGTALKELAEIAALYGVKVDGIKGEVAKLKKEKLARAKARLESAKKDLKKAKVQTSAKSRAKDADEEDFDVDPDLEDDEEG